MASLKSPKVPVVPENNQDLISTLPCITTDKILKRLPLKMAAKMSVLSKSWRDKWLSFEYLVFDETFWDCGWEKGVHIVNSIILHHNGPVQEFRLEVPLSLEDASRMTNLHLSQWLSFLSRVGVRKIILVHYGSSTKPIPSYIYLCKDLVKLKLKFCFMTSLPRDFKGFAYLQSLELSSIAINSDVFNALIACCPRLIALRLEGCGGIKNVVINVPNLKHLTILGSVESIGIKNGHCLDSISLSLCIPSINLIGDLEFIASLCDVKSLHFGQRMCKLVASACISKSVTLAFNHLQSLNLTEVEFHDIDVFRFILGMLQNCPAIKDLEIAISPNRGVVLHEFECDITNRLAHLVKAKITGITGSKAELKLIECVLSTAVVLKELSFSFDCDDTEKEVKVLRELLQLPRASTKARVVFINN